MNDSEKDNDNNVLNRLRQVKEEHEKLTKESESLVLEIQSINQEIIDLENQQEKISQDGNILQQEIQKWQIKKHEMDKIILEYETELSNKSWRKKNIIRFSMVSSSSKSYYENNNKDLQSFLSRKESCCRHGIPKSCDWRWTFRKRRSWTQQH